MMAMGLQACSTIALRPGNSTPVVSMARSGTRRAVVADQDRRAGLTLMTPPYVVSLTVEATESPSIGARAESDLRVPTRWLGGRHRCRRGLYCSLCVREEHAASRGRRALPRVRARAPVHGRSPRGRCPLGGDARCRDRAARGHDRPSHASRAARCGCHRAPGDRGLADPWPICGGPGRRADAVGWRIARRAGIPSRPSRAHRAGRARSGGGTSLRGRPSRRRRGERCGGR